MQILSLKQSKLNFVSIPNHSKKRQKIITGNTLVHGYTTIEIISKWCGYDKLPRSKKYIEFILGEFGFRASIGRLLNRFYSN